MGNKSIKALIINSDIKFTKEIQGAIPDYFDVSFSRYQDAKEKLRTGIDDKNIGLVILNADEDSTNALSIFKYIKEDPDRVGLKNTPVILLTADEFAPHCLDFYDVADPFFYSQSIDDSDFFMAISDCIEEAEMAALDTLNKEEKTEKNTIVKSPEKLMGTVYSIDTSVPEAMRVASYEDKKVIEKMSESVKNTKRTAKEVYEILENFLKEKEAIGEKVELNLGLNKSKLPKPAINVPISKWKIKNDISSIHQLNDVSKVNDLLVDDYDPLNVEPEDDDFDPALINYSDAYLWNKRTTINTPVNIIRRDAVSVPKEPTGPKSVLIVDTDKNSLKAFELFLNENYKVAIVDSNMKAIDYIVKNKTDIIVIANDVNGMSGTAITRSIKNQPAGMQSKICIMIDENSPYQEYEEVKTAMWVSGVIKKPIIKKQLLAVLNRL